MKITFILCAITQAASGRYFFDTNILNGVAQPSYKYVRSSTRATKYNPIKFSSNDPVNIRDGSFVDGPDIRCNQGAFDSAVDTEVLTVTAGSDVRFRVGFGATMQHPGPGLVYMSRAPGDNVTAYDGSGDWFKIFQEGVCNTDGDFTNDAWCTWDRNYIVAKIPANTPNGEYLVRVEHIGVHKSFVNQPEHFAACMQLKVTGGGNGTPDPLVKFPGAYKDSDAYANFSIYGGYRPFPFPGPAVWNGSGSSTLQSTTTRPTGTTTRLTRSTSTTTHLAGTTTIAASNPQFTAACAVDTTAAAAAATPNIVTGAALYDQCGGIKWAGAKTCAEGRCVVSNKWYSQCLL